MFDKLNFLYTSDDPPAGDPPTGDTPPAADPVTPPPDGGGEGKKEYTQAELDTMFVDRAKRAGKTALTDLYADLGLKDVKALKSLVADAKKKADDEKSDLEKAQGVAADWEAKHVKLAASQQSDRVRYAVEKAARAAKVLPEAVADMFALVDTTLIKFDDAGMPQGVDKAVASALKERKHLIQTNGARTDNDANAGTGSAQTGGYTDAQIQETANNVGVSAQYIKQGLEEQKIRS